ncbi:MAG: AI-2E family transporter [Candidatus Competibacterales bacterium]|nr:AI-2E family transporter [Candidatus Competibacterales bacterium]
MNIVSDWIRRVLTDSQAVVLLVLLFLGLAVIMFMGEMLAPVFAGLVLAYLLEGPVQYLQQWRLSRRWAVLIVFAVFSAFLVFLVLGLLPPLSYQLSQLVRQLPNMVVKGQDLLMNLPEEYPTFISKQQVTELIDGIRADVGTLGQYVVSWSLASVVSLITLAIYLFLVPLLVFFFLKDKEALLRWFLSFMPRDYTLSKQVWHEVDLQMGNYVRGKFIEIIIVWSASFLTFTLLGLQFAMLLGMMVGLSVIIPYIGAAVVTIPVALVGLFQWGFGQDFVWLMIAYAVIQALDGNVLVPLLFSEVVDLHPIAIIVAVLVFGGVWGFWGVFFAIPLATVVQAVLKAWPDKTSPLSNKG